MQTSDMKHPSSSEETENNSDTDRLEPQEDQDDPIVLKPDVSGENQPADGDDVDGPELGQIDKSFFLVAVGASAGGLDAIRTFISQVPETCPHSFIFIQHISPDYKSMMADLLKKDTALAIEEVKNGMTIEPSHIYVIPPKANVIIEGTHPSEWQQETEQERSEAECNPRGNGRLRFALLDQAPRRTLNLPIDLFFHSLAEAVGDRAIGVVLSGSGSDGSRGLRTIKDAEGFIMVQDPETAAFDSMPRSAISTHLVDVVCSPDSMVKELYGYLSLRASKTFVYQDLFENNEADYNAIIQIVSTHVNIDFSKYKKPTLQRRIGRRMALNDCQSLRAYLDFLQDNANEIKVLYLEFLVGVTHLFRDRPAWEALETTAFPKLFEQRDITDPPVKIWSVGCSTGEEAYTIAIMLDKYCRDNSIQRDFRIFATDVNESSIRIAQEGFFPSSAIEDVPREYSSRYFKYSSSGIRVKDSIRRKIVFAKHNVVEDPPYIHTDLIICRNMLIYMTFTLQSQIMATFSYSLRADGLLFLGASESVERGISRFEPVDRRWRLFRNVEKAKSRDLRVLDARAYYATAGTAAVSVAPLPPNNQPSLNLLQVVLPQLNACVIIVDEYWKVIDTHGSYQRFLTLPASKFSTKIVELLPKRLSSAAVITIRQAVLNGQSSHPPVREELDGKSTWVSIICERIESDNKGIYYVLTLNEVPNAQSQAGSGAVGAGDTPAELDHEHYTAELEAELTRTRENLEATIEDLASSNEELQSSNEELMSANEELQSAGEEMQSVNEELHTINTEHAIKISELEGAYADIDNLLKGTDIGIVLLDKDKKIRRFSQAIKGCFALDDQDIGRPFHHFTSYLVDDGHRCIQSAIETVLETDHVESQEIRGVDRGTYLATVKPYRTISGEPEGLILTFVDITQIKSLQDEVETKRDVLEAVLEGQMAGFWDWNLVENTEYLSPQFKLMFGYGDHELENSPETWQSLIHKDDLPKVMECLDAHVSSRGKIPFDNEARYFHKDGSIVWVWYRGKVIEWTPEGNPVRMVGGHVDITPLKNREEEILAQADELRQFAYISAHDLREPMNTIDNYITMLSKKLSDRLDEREEKMMGFVSGASRRMKALIAGVIEYAKLQQGEGERADIDMEALVGACRSDLHEVIEAAQAELQIDDLPKAHGVKGLVHRVLLNLVSNAVKFHKPGHKPIVRIGGTGDGAFSQYYVIDNGIGIAPEFRGTVFELFTRLNANAEYEGVGLGLALSRKIISKHGGRIWVEDGDDGGTAIRFTLPADGGKP